MSSPVPLLFDATHLVTRQGIVTPTGIDRVDTAYAHFLAEKLGLLHAGIHYGLRGPHVLARPRIADLSRRQLARWHDGSDDPHDDPQYGAVRAFLTNGSSAGVPTRISGRRRNPQVNRRIALDKVRQRLVRDKHLAIPEGAVYLNVAQYLLELPFLLRWLKKRPDVSPVFFIHDLLPLDYPEYFPAERKIRFPRILETALSHASGLIVTSEATRDRVAAHLAHHGRGPLPIHVGHLPAGERFRPILTRDPELDRSAFVMAVGTVEPRKNHLFLLNLWRHFAERGIAAPKLLIVGAIGWENEGVLDMLDRCEALRGRVLLVSGLSDGAYRHLLGHARALLAASFAEGYGIPIAEALATGTPVVASDIAVFREVTQGLATFCDPLDGPAWQRAIQQTLDLDRLIEKRRAAKDYRTPQWDDYFAGVLDFLGTLKRM